MKIFIVATLRLRWMSGGRWSATIAALAAAGIEAVAVCLLHSFANAAHERRINADVEHPAMRALELPYPVAPARSSVP